MAKYVLDSNPEEFNFLLFGISCTDNQYVLAANINTALGIDLRLSNYIDLSHRLGKDFKFSFFDYLDEEFNLEYNLIPNKSNNVAKGGGENNDGDLFSAFNENIP